MAAGAKRASPHYVVLIACALPAAWACSGISTMLFASNQFIFFFLPLVLLVYWSLKKNRPQNFFLLVASVLFYFWGEVWNIAVLFVCVLISYFVARRVQPGAEHRHQFRWLVAGVSLQLFLLFVFKYFTFSVVTLNSVLGALGIERQFSRPLIFLPLGISFFVFHAISYMVDAYRGSIKPESRFGIVALYFFLFPHQVAGPIVRYSHFAPDADQRNLGWSEVSAGIERFVMGLAKKVLIANSAAQGADAIFALGMDDLSTPLSWIGALCYTVQIYFDFSGYSDMAIGLARMLGFHFHENFNFPYAAKSVTDFWRRWHISLSTWFRDYLYIPLGGNRGSALRTYLNLVIVFALCGFWHGPNWTFLVWGLWHGAFLVLERANLVSGLLRARGVNTFWTLLVVVVGWVFFRADSLGHAVHFIARMFEFRTVVGDSDFHLHRIVTPVVALGLLLGFAFASGHLGRFFKRRAHFAQGIIYVALLMGSFVLSLVQLAGSTFNPFIYFRF